MAEWQSDDGRLQLAREIGHFGLWHWDIGADEVVWSAGLEAIHGRDDRDFRGTLEDHQRDIHLEDRPAVQRALRATIDGGKDWTKPLRGGLVTEGAGSASGWRL